MVRHSFVFLVVFLAGLLPYLNWIYATSVVPGWHTSIYPPWFGVNFFQVLWLGTAAAIYFFVERRGRVVHQWMFKTHLFLSLLAFLDNTYTSYGSTNEFNLLVFIVAPFGLYILGQVIFIVGVLKAKRMETIK